jgi:hypothetical protein
MLGMIGTNSTIYVSLRFRLESTRLTCQGPVQDKPNWDNGGHTEPISRASSGTDRVSNATSLGLVSRTSWSEMPCQNLPLSDP